MVDVIGMVLEGKFAADNDDEGDVCEVGIEREAFIVVVEARCCLCRRISNGSSSTVVILKLDNSATAVASKLSFLIDNRWWDKRLLFLFNAADERSVTVEVLLPTFSKEEL